MNTHTHTHTHKDGSFSINKIILLPPWLHGISVFFWTQRVIFLFSVRRLMIWSSWDNESRNTTSLLCLQFRTIFIFVSRCTKSERAAVSVFMEWQSLLSLSLSVLWVLGVRFPADGQQCLLQAPTEASCWRRSGFHKWFDVTCPVLNVCQMTKRCTQQHVCSMKKRFNRDWSRSLTTSTACVPAQWEKCSLTGI